MQFSDCYFLGTITKTHGLKGHLTVKLDTDEPSLYYNLESVFVELSSQQLVPFFIEEITILKPYVLKVLFSTETPELLLGKSLYLPLNTLPKLSGKQFYFYEIIGFSLMVENTTVGKIISVNDASAQALFIVEKDDKEKIIPIINDWIIEINRKEKYISMQLPEGLLEI